MSPEPPSEQGVIAVRSELVHDQIISRIVGESLHRLEKGVPEAIGHGADVLEAVCGPEAETAAPDAKALATRLAAAGYIARIVEGKMFEAAQQPMPGLAERSDAAASVARELALEEPESKPDPGTGSWRVPGPGGHVRHFAALAIANELWGANNGSAPPAPLDRQREAKRCFIYGFYLRCCEEAG